jgi:gluconate 2-dehydrogenase alpha chain
METCIFCGFCERFACPHYAKGSPQTTMLPVLLQNPNYELRTLCEVLRINLDSTRKKATGVTYVDDTGQEFEQPAELVLITAFPLNNVRTLLLSGIGEHYDPKTGNIRPSAGPPSSWTRASTSIRSWLRAPAGP